MTCPGTLQTPVAETLGLCRDGGLGVAHASGGKLVQARGVRPHGGPWTTQHPLADSRTPYPSGRSLLLGGPHLPTVWGPPWPGARGPPQAATSPSFYQNPTLGSGRALRSPQWEEISVHPLPMWGSPRGCTPVPWAPSSQGPPTAAGWTPDPVPGRGAASPTQLLRTPVRAPGVASRAGDTEGLGNAQPPLPPSNPSVRRGRQPGVGTPGEAAGTPGGPGHSPSERVEGQRARGGGALGAPLSGRGAPTASRRHLGGTGRGCPRAPPGAAPGLGAGSRPGLVAAGGRPPDTGNRGGRWGGTSGTALGEPGVRGWVPLEVPSTLGGVGLGAPPYPGGEGASPPKTGGTGRVPQHWPQD